MLCLLTGYFSEIEEKKKKNTVWLHNEKDWHLESHNREPMITENRALVTFKTGNAFLEGIDCSTAREN